MSGQEWVPEFEGQRPPFEPGHSIGEATRFEPGNEVSLRHAIHSPRKVEPLAEEYVAALLADPSTPRHVMAPQYRLELQALGRAETGAAAADGVAG